MKAFNPKSYDRFYHLVESCVTLGRPCILQGAKGVGKTYMLTELLSEWRCKKTIKSKRAVLYRQASTLENPATALRSLVSHLTTDLPKGNRVSDLRVCFENALLASKIRLIIIDKAEAAKPELYNTIWASLERVKAKKHPVGLVLSYSEERDLLRSLPEIAESLPVLGSFHMDALDAPNCLQALAYWVPVFKPLDDALFGEDRECEAFKKADYLASLIRSLTGGTLLELSDLAWYWQNQFPDRVPDISGIKEIWAMRGRISPLIATISSE